MTFIQISPFSDNNWSMAYAKPTFFLHLSLKIYRLFTYQKKDEPDTTSLRATMRSSFWFEEVKIRPWLKYSTTKQDLKIGVNSSFEGPGSSYYFVHTLFELSQKTLCDTRSVNFEVQGPFSWIQMKALVILNKFCSTSVQKLFSVLEISVKEYFRSRPFFTF